MADEGDDDLAAAATIVLPVLNNKTKRGPLTNSDTAFQSRDSKFIIQNRTVF